MEAAAPRRAPRSRRSAAGLLPREELRAKALGAAAGRHTRSGPWVEDRCACRSRAFPLASLCSRQRGNLAPTRQARDRACSGAGHCSPARPAGGRPRGRPRPRPARHRTLRSGALPATGASPQLFADTFLASHPDLSEECCKTVCRSKCDPRKYRRALIPVHPQFSFALLSTLLLRSSG